MKLKNVNVISSKLDEKNRTAILELIDMKNEDEMEKVLKKMDAKFEQIKSDSNTKFDHLEAMMTTQFNMMKWILAFAATAITIVLSIFAMK